MLATIINVILILLGSAAGLLFKNLISERLMSILTHALGLCVLGIGISSMIGTQDTLCVIVCMAAGTVLGHAIDIEGRLEGAGDLLRARSKGAAGTAALPRALSARRCCSAWGPWPSPAPSRRD